MPPARPSAPAATSSRWRRRAPRAPTSPAPRTSSTTASAPSSSPTSPSSRRCRAPSPAAGSASCSPPTTSSRRTRAKFVSKYANIGLTPDLGVSTLLPAAIGQRRALQLLLQDRTLSTPPTALDWGLVTEVVPRDEVAARAEAVARFWLENATARVRPGQAPRPRGRRAHVRREPRRRGRLDRRPLRHRRGPGARRGLRRGIRQIRPLPPDTLPCLAERPTSRHGLRDT